jgi:hypothetical protein
MNLLIDIQVERRIMIMYNKAGRESVEGAITTLTLTGASRSQAHNILPRDSFHAPDSTGAFRIIAG